MGSSESPSALTVPRSPLRSSSPNCVAMEIPSHASSLLPAATATESRQKRPSEKPHHDDYPKPFFVMDWLEELLEKTPTIHQQQQPQRQQPPSPPCAMEPKTPKSSNRKSVTKDEDAAPTRVSSMPALRLFDDDDDEEEPIEPKGLFLPALTEPQKQPQPRGLAPRCMSAPMLLFGRWKQPQPQRRTKSATSPPPPPTAFRANLPALIGRHIEEDDSFFRLCSLEISKAWTVRGKRAACERGDWRTARTCWNNAYDIRAQLGCADLDELERLRELAASALGEPTWKATNPDFAGMSRMTTIGRQ